MKHYLRELQKSDLFINRSFANHLHKFIGMFLGTEHYEDVILPLYRGIDVNQKIIIDTARLVSSAVLPKNSLRNGSVFTMKIHSNIKNSLAETNIIEVKLNDTDVATATLEYSANESISPMVTEIDFFVREDKGVLKLYCTGSNVVVKASGENCLISNLVGVPVDKSASNVVSVYFSWGREGKLNQFVTNLVEGEGVAAEGSVTFQSIDGHKYLDTLNESIVVGDGEILTATNTSEATANIMIIDLTEASLPSEETDIPALLELFPTYKSGTFAYIEEDNILRREVATTIIGG